MHTGRVPATSTFGLIVLVLSLLAAVGPVAASGHLVRNGPRDRNLVALTFDADMTPAMRQAVLDGRAVHYDPRITALLRETATPATHFITGLWAQTYPDEVRSFALDPLLEVANHSWDHRAFRAPCYGLPSLTTDTARRQQVRRTAAYIKQLTGLSTTYFRFPGGCHAASDISLVYRQDHVPVQWDVISGDAFQTNPTVIVKNVLTKVRGGSIVVFHLTGAPNAPRTYQALRTIIPELRARGFVFVTLSQLLATVALPR